MKEFFKSKKVKVILAIAFVILLIIKWQIAMVSGMIFLGYLIQQRKLNTNTGNTTKKKFALWTLIFVSSMVFIATMGGSNSSSVKNQNIASEPKTSEVIEEDDEEVEEDKDELDLDKNSKPEDSKDSKKSESNEKSESKQEDSESQGSSSQAINEHPNQDTSSVTSTQSGASNYLSNPTPNTYGNGTTNSGSSSSVDYGSGSGDKINTAASQGKVVGNTASHIYHLPGQQGYNMSSSHAVYFDTEQDAINAGYHISKR